MAVLVLFLFVCFAQLVPPTKVSQSIWFLHQRPALCQTCKMGVKGEGGRESKKGGMISHAPQQRTEFYPNAEGHEELLLL